MGDSRGSFFAGLGLSLACQLSLVLGLVLWMAIFKDVIAYFLVLGSGALQWIVIVPWILWLRKRGKALTIKGVIVMSILGMIVNGVLVAMIAGRNSNSTGPLF